MNAFLKNKKVLAHCHIYQMLNTASKFPHLSFHTPGHKVGRYDLTELSFSDNLSAPKGCIRQAEEDIAAIVGAEKSFILTDGSTSGVLSMLYVAKLRGVKRVAIFGDAHKSVYNGCALFGLTPLPAQSLHDEEIIGNAEALLLTSPNYYGEIADLKGARESCDKTGKLLLVDGAHGGHLHFQKEIYVGSYAHLWVDGVHKSLPAFTQGAVVSTSQKEFLGDLRKAVDMFRTTSPSYPIMASVEYAVKYPRNIIMEKEAESFKAKYPTRILQNADWTKLCVVFGDSAFEVEKLLEQKGVYAEFCDGNVIMFYLSPATGMRSFGRLQKILQSLFEKYPLEKNGVGRVALSEDEEKNEPTVSALNKTEWVELERSENRICAENCGLFPPCTPLIKAGEKITDEKIKRLQCANNVFGIIENKIMVYKDEK